MFARFDVVVRSGCTASLLLRNRLFRRRLPCIEFPAPTVSVIIGLRRAAARKPLRGMQSEGGICASEQFRRACNSLSNEEPPISTRRRETFERASTKLPLTLISDIVRACDLGSLVSILRNKLALCCISSTGASEPLLWGISSTSALCCANPACAMCRNVTCTSTRLTGAKDWPLERRADAASGAPLWPTTSREELSTALEFFGSATTSNGTAS